MTRFHYAPSPTGFTLAVLVGTGLLLLASAPVAAAADPAKEITTASQHADYAAEATVLKTATTHLHHVINCLEGPQGGDYDSKEADPCKEMGNGAIPDVSEAATKMQLTMAVTKAKDGLNAKDLATAQTSAKAVQAILSQLK